MAPLHNTHPSHPPSRSGMPAHPACAPRPPALRGTAAHTTPRFANDWIGATLRLCPERRLARIASGGIEWLLAANDIDTLVAAAPEALDAPGVPVEWNPGLERVLVPGAFERVGTSFFALDRQSAS